MKVYLVEHGVYAERFTAGIYSSLEKAMKAHPAPGEPGGPPLEAVPGVQTNPSHDRVREGGWKEVRSGEWENGFDMGWASRIYECVLDA